MIYLGIDPGLQGAIAAIRNDGLFLGVWDIPTIGKTTSKRDYDIRALWDLMDLTDLRTPLGLPEVRVALVVVEKVHAMPRQGVTSMFTFGRGLGILEACIMARKYPMAWASPAYWKMAMGIPAGSDKDLARLRAKQLYPAADLSLKKHVGRADALLIAEYGRARHQSLIPPTTRLS